MYARSHMNMYMHISYVHVYMYESVMPCYVQVLSLRVLSFRSGVNAYCLRVWSLCRFKGTWLSPECAAALIGLVNVITLGQIPASTIFACQCSASCRSRFFVPQRIAALKWKTLDSTLAACHEYLRQLTAISQILAKSSNPWLAP